MLGKTGDLMDLRKNYVELEVWIGAFDTARRAAISVLFIDHKYQWGS